MRLLELVPYGTHIYISYRELATTELDTGTINRSSQQHQVLEKESARRSRICVQMALFFDPEEWNPLSEDMGRS